MRAGPVVGVIGTRIEAAMSAQIGYGPRDLDDYSVECMDALLVAGMRPVGIASLPEMGEHRSVELIDALVLSPGGRCEAVEGRPSSAPEASQASLVSEALRRGLPVLAICGAFAPLREALDAGAGQARGGPTYADHGLRELIASPGAQGLRHPITGFVPAAGLRAAAFAPDGSVDALIGAGLPVLAVRWHPEALPAGHASRNGPFNWLRDGARRA
jgi:gamma-glutamyl-gamma-aminobutyrate hydrolase PuuD